MNFFDSNYVNLSEVCDKLNIHIAIFSSWNNDELKDSPEEHKIIKRGASLFIHKDCPRFKFYKKRLENIKMTDYSDMLPLDYLKREFNFNENYISNLGEIIKMNFKKKQNKSNAVTTKFLKFRPEIRERIKNKTWSEIRAQEATEFKDLDLFQVNKDSYLCCY